MDSASSTKLLKSTGRTERAGKIPGAISKAAIAASFPNGCIIRFFIYARTEADPPPVQSTGQATSAGGTARPGARPGHQARLTKNRVKPLRNTVEFRPYGGT